jgi:hypothetical protein
MYREVKVYKRVNFVMVYQLSFEFTVRERYQFTVRERYRLPVVRLRS